jgi:hypothetical protein
VPGEVTPTQIKDLHAASKEEERCPLAEQTDRARAEIDYPAAAGLCVFAFTHFGILLLSGYIAAQQADPGDTEEQRRNGFGMYTMLIVGMTLLALGSHAAALAWSRRRFRYLAPSVLIALEVVIAVLSAALALLLIGANTGPTAQLLIALLGPANVTLAIFRLMNKLESRHRNHFTKA